MAKKEFKLVITAKSMAVLYLVFAVIIGVSAVVLPGSSEPVTKGDLGIVAALLALIMSNQYRTEK